MSVSRELREETVVLLLEKSSSSETVFQCSEEPNTLHNVGDRTGRSSSEITLPSEQTLLDLGSFELITSRDMSESCFQLNESREASNRGRSCRKYRRCSTGRESDETCELITETVNLLNNIGNYSHDGIDTNHVDKGCMKDRCKVQINDSEMNCTKHDLDGADSNTMLNRTDKAGDLAIDLGNEILNLNRSNENIGNFSKDTGKTVITLNTIENEQNIGHSVVDLSNGMQVPEIVNQRLKSFAVDIEKSEVDNLIVNTEERVANKDNTEIDVSKLGSGGKRPSITFNVDINRTRSPDLNLETNRLSLTSNISMDPHCRICHCGGEDEKLISPCNCAGSLQYIHESCLVQWMKSKMVDDCELCQGKIEILRKLRPFWRWHRPTQRPYALIWVLTFVAALILNVTSVAKDASSHCTSTPCIVFYSVGCFGAILATVFLFYFARRAKAFMRHWIALNEDWVILDRDTNVLSKRTGAREPKRQRVIFGTKGLTTMV